VGSGLGSIQKMWDPLLISATVEASNFKFCTQQIVGVLSAAELPKFQDPWLRCNTVYLACSHWATLDTWNQTENLNEERTWAWWWCIRSIQWSTEVVQGL